MQNFKLVILGLAAVWPALAQSPVVLVNGFGECGPDSNTFGYLSTLLKQGGTPVYAFDNCNYPKDSIEHLGQAFGESLAAFPEPVDVIAHSMGGLIVRAYLTQELWAGRSPGIRKLILIGTPNLGSALASVPSAFAGSLQGKEMLPGSNLLRILNGAAQLQGIDVIAIAGLGSLDGDGVVKLGSAALNYLLPDGDARTRVIPYCHVTSDPCGGLTGANGAIAYVTNTTHPTYQIVRSFLDGTTAWMSVGVTPTQAMTARQRPAAPSSSRVP